MNWKDLFTSSNILGRSGLAIDILSLITSSEYGNIYNVDEICTKISTNALPNNLIVILQ